MVLVSYMRISEKKGGVGERELGRASGSPMECGITCMCLFVGEAAVERNSLTSYVQQCKCGSFR